MKTARQLLQEKQISQLISIPPDSTVLQALQTMSEWNLGAVLVMDGDKMLGIFSERDYARKVMLRGHSTATTPIKEVMTCSVMCVHPESTVSECLSLMTNKRIRHLPVVENRKVIGLLSIGDLVRAVVEHQQFTIQQLENYIYQQ